MLLLSSRPLCVSACLVTLYEMDLNEASYSLILLSDYYFKSDFELFLFYFFSCGNILFYYIKK